MTRLKLSVCPSCGSRNLKKVRKTVTGTRQGKRYSAPAVEFYECSDCDERIYDPVAIRRIERYWHVRVRENSAKKVAKPARPKIPLL
jgi:YgiT-type zinc finger domain-containing protein